MIRDPNSLLDRGEKKIRMLIAGYPGIGKTSLALSAPKPLHIDTDFGIDRIEPRYRCPYIQPQTYKELRGDLEHENLDDFETLVFDTGGKLISIIGEHIMKENPKAKQADGSLTLKGYGFVKREFNKLMDFCFYTLHKNIVIVFHAKEEKDGENSRLRIKVEGGTKEDVWEPMDLGGFMEMRGRDRVIGFDNCERYFAKGTRGVHGVRKIPVLGPETPNTFLTDLFAEYNKKSEEEIAYAAAAKKDYEAAMEAGRGIISAVVDAETANANMANFEAVKHALTSKSELFAAWNQRCAELGLMYDQAARKWHTGG